MTDTDKQPAMTYPDPEQYKGWKADAEEMDMSVSEWMQAMIEAGRKKFEVSVEPDETADQLRRQRNDLKDELERARERIEELETQLHHGEKEVIRQFITENPGATFGEITQHVIDTVPQRVNRHLDELEGEAVRVEDDEYYPQEGE
jgi:predicted RNase H-like nuclease (RuvC/YqgF family)